MLLLAARVHGDAGAVHEGGRGVRRVLLGDRQTELRRGTGVQEADRPSAQRRHDSHSPRRQQVRPGTPTQGEGSVGRSVGFCAWHGHRVAPLTCRGLCLCREFGRGRTSVGVNS